MRGTSDITPICAAFMQRERAEHPAATALLSLLYSVLPSKDMELRDLGRAACAGNARARSRQRPGSRTVQRLTDILQTLGLVVAPGLWTEPSEQLTGSIPWRLHPRPADPGSKKATSGDSKRRQTATEKATPMSSISNSSHVRPYRGAKGDTGVSKRRQTATEKAKVVVDPTKKKNQKKRTKGRRTIRPGGSFGGGR